MSIFPNRIKLTNDGIHKIYVFMKDAPIGTDIPEIINDLEKTEWNNSINFIRAPIIGELTAYPKNEVPPTILDMKELTLERHIDWKYADE